jgi:2-polyprenyl-6-methoxyphenol hydroxylase-like FAD-dependent oxidoreductase
VLATGLNQALRGSLGISQLDLDHQSVSFGFNLVSEQPDGFQFGALTSYHEQVDGKTAFITLFRLGPTMRANLFVYRQAKDPWFRAMRDAPTETLDHTFPRLKRVIGGFRVVGRVQGRVSNLTVAQDHQRPGVVLVGDAWMTPCPAAGVGAMRTMNDVEILCRSHLSGWLSSPGMSWAKIASFYADREKCECDEMAVARALHFRRLLTDSGLRWRADRYLKFCGRGAKGLIRRIRGRLRFGPEADEGSFSTFLPSDSQPDRVPGGS